MGLAIYTIYTVLDLKACTVYILFQNTFILKTQTSIKMSNHLLTVKQLQNIVPYFALFR